MNKKNEINFDTTELLSQIYEARENMVYSMKEEKDELVNKEQEEYSKLDIAINNIPDGFKETIMEIRNSIENYIDALSAIQISENEKFYKCGFSDAFKLFIECLGENTDIKKKY